MRNNRVFIVLFLTMLVAMLGAGVIAPVMPLYGETLGASGFGLGMVYSSFSISRAIFMPMTGKISDRKGRKQFIVTGLVIYTLASLGYIWSGTTLELIWIRFLHGVGSAMIVPIAAAAIGDVSPRGREGSVMGTFNVALFLGFGIGPLLGGLVMVRLGMAPVFYIMGGLSGLSLLLILIFLPEKKRNARSKDRADSSSIKRLWRIDRFRGLLVFRLSNAMVRGSTTAFLPVFAARLEVDAARIGFLVSLNILLAAVLQHFFGRLADRMNRAMLMVTGNLMTALPLLLTPVAGTYGHLVGLAVVMGVGTGLAFPAASAVATEVGRHHGMGNVMGFFNQSMSLGMIIGPLAAGWIMDIWGVNVVFIFAGAAGIFGSVLTLRWMGRKPEGKDADV
ncbi:MAG TPA: MFS transporter [bacterium]|nr:MFS transporter [bacterium]